MIFNPLCGGQTEEASHSLKAPKKIAFQIDAYSEKEQERESHFKLLCVYEVHIANFFK